MEWLAFFAGIAAAMLLGYLGMAHPSRNIFLEVASFCVAMLAGLVAGTAILTTASAGLEVYLITVFESCTATLFTAIPKLAWQSVRANQFTIGLLFRLTAYVAFLLLVESHFEDGPVLWILGLGVFVAGLAFYATWGFARVVPGWLLWLLIVPGIAYVLAIAFFFCIIAFETDFEDFVDLWVLPWDWPHLVQEIGYGTLAFTILIAVAGQLHRALADKPGSPLPACQPQHASADDCQ